MLLHNNNNDNTMFLQLPNGTNVTIIMPSHERDKNNTDSFTNNGTIIHDDNNTTGHHPTVPPPLGAPLKRDTYTIVVSIIIGLLVLLSIILPLLPYIRRSLRRRASRDKRKIAKRYRAIDAWLITKEVVEHSDQCSCPEPPCNQQVASDDGEDNASKECIICMEEFAVGSAVSWSPRVNGCRHVFHKNCIRQWLLRHMGCPYCRQMMFPFDNAGRRLITDRETIRLWAAERTKHSDATHYCLSHGLVVNDTTSNENSQTMTARTSTHDDDDDDEELGYEVEEEEGMCVEPPLSKGNAHHDEEGMGSEPPVPQSGDDSDGIVETDLEVLGEQENRLIANDEETEERIEADIEAPVEQENSLVVDDEIEEARNIV